MHDDHNTCCFYHPHDAPGANRWYMIGRSNCQKAESPSCFRYASKYSMGAEGDDIAAHRPPTIRLMVVNNDVMCDV